METKHTIDLKGFYLEYTLRVSKVSRSVRLLIYPGGRVVVSAPRFVWRGAVEKLLLKKSDWIREKVEKFKKIPLISQAKNSRTDFLLYKNKALKLVKERLEYFNKTYRFTYRKISIRNQKTRWGSCSRKGNLSFNYKIALLSPPLIDYVVVHELCHLQEFNHSKNFWHLVARAIPDYLERSRKVKKNSLV